MALTELQMGLIALGAAGVAGVLAYNKWQERKFRRQADKVFRTEHEDVLLAPGGSGAEGTRIEPTVGSAGVVPAPAEPEVPMPIPEPGELEIDQQVDCVAKLECAEPVLVSSLWYAQKDVLEATDQRLRWFGWDEADARWCVLDGHVVLASRHFRVALQLANRSGPVSQAEFDRFVAGVQQLADRFLAVAETPDRNQTLARASELDRFCGGTDIQIGINVVSQGADGFGGGQIRSAAEAAGLILREDGMFHAESEDGRTEFMFANLEPAVFAPDHMNLLTTKGLTFTLDVPRVRAGTRAFDRMVQIARRTAGALNGRVVDDNRQPLTDRSLELIRDKVAEFQKAMEERGIPAGGATALRLFS